MPSAYLVAVIAVAIMLILGFVVAWAAEGIRFALFVIGFTVATLGVAGVIMAASFAIAASLVAT